MNNKRNRIEDINFGIKIKNLFDIKKQDRYTQLHNIIGQLF